MQYIFLLLKGLTALCYIIRGKGPVLTKDQARRELHCLSFSILVEGFIFVNRPSSCSVGKSREPEGSVCSSERKLPACSGKSNYVLNYRGLHPVVRNINCK
jgi:hypothetical protein